MENIEKRKGASSPKNVPERVLEKINAGEISTVNLGETLAVDNIALLDRICEDSGIVLDTSALRADAENKKLMTCYKNIARLIINELGKDELKIFSTHVSDIARCWACLATGYEKAEFAEKMVMIKPFADDAHMGVREMAWMALRDDIDASPVYAVDCLVPWTADASANIRRCASEATRPRGVWCRHIQFFKENPEAGLKILEPLRSDSSKYVRDSVANWLNDASKSRPTWVVSVTDRWMKESGTKETEKICKRALRTIRKNG